MTTIWWCYKTTIYLRVKLLLFQLKKLHIGKASSKPVESNINVIRSGIISGSFALQLEVYFGHIKWNKNPIQSRFSTAHLDVSLAIHREPRFLKGFVSLKEMAACRSKRTNSFVHEQNLSKLDYSAIAWTTADPGPVRNFHCQTWIFIHFDINAKPHSQG